MTGGGVKMGMTPPHPGTFIQIEAFDELGLSESAAARILGVCRATLSDLVLAGLRDKLMAPEEAPRR